MIELHERMRTPESIANYHDRTRQVRKVRLIAEVLVILASAGAVSLALKAIVSWLR